MSIGTLLNKQNPDGGWPYVRGGSWTEPTVYAVMALLAGGENGPARRGLQWIRSLRRPDGGWPPRAGIDQSVWVTGLVALLPPAELDPRMHQSAVDWLLDAQGKETTRAYRMREWLLGMPQPLDQDFPGWPWVLNTAAWVGPSSVAILALQNEEKRRPSGRLSSRISGGQNFLLARMCKGGGWNHGSSNALGYASHPYPETTGMALAALRGVQHPKVTMAIDVARGFLDDCRSGDALNWLRLGLRAHGQLPPGFCPPPDVTWHTIPEMSLDLLVSRAAARGEEMFPSLA